MLRILLHQSNMILSDYRVSLEVDMNVLVIILSLTLTEENGEERECSFSCQPILILILMRWWNTLLTLD